MKTALIILDGIADRSQEALGWRTPLQAASLPNLDAVARAGACGHMYPLEPGVCPSSDTSLWEILGCGRHPFPGRTSIEALGAGIDIDEGEVAFRVTLASTMLEDGKRYMQVAPAYLPESDGEEIARSLSAYQPASFETVLHHLGGPFMALVLSGGASCLVTDSDPLLFRLPVARIAPLAGAPEAAVRTAEELERFLSWAHGVLEAHPVNRKRAAEGMPPINHVLVKWPSVRPSVPPFASAWGFNGFSAASGNFYEGLACLLGMESIARCSKDPGEELYDRLVDAKAALDRGFDFALVHTKAPDEASHTGRPKRKVRVCEELDLALSLVVQSFLRDPELLTVITADHATPSSGTDEVIHSGESVPLVMAGRNVRVDAVESFDEVACALGSLGTLRGRDVMPLVLNFTNRARFGTSRIQPDDVPYHPNW